MVRIDESVRRGRSLGTIHSRPARGGIIVRHRMARRTTPGGRSMTRLLIPACAALALTAPAAADNWPAWRGPDGQGHSAEKNLPVTWDVAHNVRWKTPLPDEGNSTPVVWGDRVF